MRRRLCETSLFLSGLSLRGKNEIARRALSCISEANRHFTLLLYSSRISRSGVLNELMKTKVIKSCGRVRIEAPVWQGKARFELNTGGREPSDLWYWFPNCEVINLVMQMTGTEAND